MSLHLLPGAGGRAALDAHDRRSTADVDAGLIPAESTMGRKNPAAHMLADLLELARPDSEQATTFTGVFAERDRTG